MNKDKDITKVIAYPSRTAKAVDDMVWDHGLVVVVGIGFAFVVGVLILGVYAVITKDRIR